MDHVSVLSNGLAGIVVGPSGLATASNASVSGTPIGAAVENTAEPIACLASGMIYSNNQVNLDSTVLPNPCVMNCATPVCPSVPAF